MIKVYEIIDRLPINLFNIVANVLTDAQRVWLFPTSDSMIIGKLESVAGGRPVRRSARNPLIDGSNPVINQIYSLQIYKKIVSFN